MIKIDIFSDTICPWCYIGKKRLDKAISKFSHEKFRITWRPFQLNPNMQAVIFHPIRATFNNVSSFIIKSNSK